MGVELKNECVYLFTFSNGYVSRFSIDIMIIDK